MCGIVGFRKIDKFYPREKGRQVLYSMMNTIVHRGPDAEGVFLNGDVALGHRRLSIIDLSGGLQPMALPDKSVVVTFNGEIYNYKDLRRQLEGKGYRFKTNSDTEVLLHGYAEWGVDMIPLLDGMFSFGIWDERKKRLVLARDPFGKKPLYYCTLNGIFYFASELKALRVIPRASFELDTLSLHQYLCYEYVPAPRSIYREVAKLEAGHYMIVDRHGTEDRKYWDFHIEEGGGLNGKNERDILADLDSIMRKAVEKRLMSDVPLGIFLSGGIDSSLITAYMADIVDSPASIKTFTIGFSDRSFDESDFARTIARTFGTDHHEEMLEPEHLLDIMPEIVANLDEPFADASLIPTSLLSKFTAHHVKVALGGDGGDELFFGYPTFQATMLNSVYRMVPGFIDAMIKRFVKLMPVSHDNISLDFKIKQFLKAAKTDLRYYHQVWLGSLDYAESIELLSSPKHSVEEVFSPHIAAYRKDLGLLNNASETYVKTYLTDDILVKTDRASMAYSLEVRAPLLDKDLASYVMRLPAEYKMNGLTVKYILKKLLRNRVPQEIVKRPKKGFGIPVAKWFKGPLRVEMMETLSVENIRKTGVFNPATVQIYINEHLNNIRDNRKILWTIYIFQKWALANKDL